jgi:hypothetical protein
MKKITNLRVKARFFTIGGACARCTIVTGLSVDHVAEVCSDHHERGIGANYVQFDSLEINDLYSNIHRAR